MSERPGRQPIVVLDVDYAKGSFELVVANIGDGVAHDIGVKFSRKLVGADGVVVTSLPVWTQLRTLRPGKEIRVFVDTATSLFAQRKVNTFDAAVRWQDTAGGEYTARYRHDLDIYRLFPERV